MMCWTYNIKSSRAPIFVLNIFLMATNTDILLICWIISLLTQTVSKRMFFSSQCILSLLVRLLTVQGSTEDIWLIKHQLRYRDWHSYHSPKSYLPFQRKLGIVSYIFVYGYHSEPISILLCEPSSRRVVHIFLHFTGEKNDTLCQKNLSGSR